MNDSLFDDLVDITTPDPPADGEKPSKSRIVPRDGKAPLCAYIDEFIEAVECLAEIKKDKYPNEEWRYIPKLEWEQHVLQKIEEYAVQHEGARVPLPWIKMALFCLIGYVKETHEDANRQRLNVELKRQGGETAHDPRG